MTGNNRDEEIINTDEPFCLTHKAVHSSLCMCLYKRRKTEKAHDSFNKGGRSSHPKPL